MSVAGFLIIENHFSRSNKRVSFCNDVKEYDGSSRFNQNFSKLCNKVFQPKCLFSRIDNSFDVIGFLDDNHITPRPFIEKCLEESNIIKTKLLVLQRQDKILQMANDLYKSVVFVKSTEEDAEDEYLRYWDHEFWRSRSVQINSGCKKIALLRTGSRDFNFCLTVSHLPQLEAFIQILNETLEWY
jgi:hypothetical protein